MTTGTKDCKDQQPDGRKRKCLTCEPGDFCRNHYYRGKLLTERDFTAEQRYFMDKDRLHNLALHGWGVVCGLRVKPHPHCPELRAILEPGLAIDTCGREVRVVHEIEIPLPAAPPKRKEEPCPDEPPPEKPHPHHQKQQLSGDDSGEYYPEDEHQPLPTNPCDDSPVPVDLYLCIRYAECETEFSPAPFDDCGCNSDGQQPNRICEGFDLTLAEEKPEWWDQALDLGCKIENCERLFWRQQKNCVEVDRYPCIPLAVLRNVTPGAKVTPEQIDNHARVTLASTSTLEGIIRCILEKLPTREMTRINEINWEHGQRILCHQFMSEFVGSGQNPRGFEIRFDSKVYARSIDTRSFQALVIFRPDDLSSPREMELAPAHIERDEFETEWCRLRIDSGYAKRRLDGRNFDLFITLKCNVITGKNGLAVDGDYLATRETDDVWRMVLPTGNNVPGGTFESWIRVRPRPKGGPEEPRRSAS